VDWRSQRHLRGVEGVPERRACSLDADDLRAEEGDGLGISMNVVSDKFRGATFVWSSVMDEASQTSSGAPRSCGRP
jgi:hypothetical protein